MNSESDLAEQEAADNAMPVYSVEVEETRMASTHLLIEAPNEEEAKRYAQALIDEGVVFEPYDFGGLDDHVDAVTEVPNSPDYWWDDFTDV